MELVVSDGSPRPRMLSSQARRAAGVLRPRVIRQHRDDDARFVRLLGFDPKAMEAGELAIAAARPRTRGDCEDGPRPCPWVGCSQHLYLDVTKTGALKLNHPGVAPWEMPTSCALDVAAAGEHILDEVGLLLNLTRERVRQLEVSGLHALRAASPDHDLDASALDLFPHREAA